MLELIVLSENLLNGMCIINKPQYVFILLNLVCKIKHSLEIYLQCNIDKNIE